jgi:hypothetical protein
LQALITAAAAARLKQPHTQHSYRFHAQVQHQVLLLLLPLVQVLCRVQLLAAARSGSCLLLLLLLLLLTQQHVAAAAVAVIRLAAVFPCTVGLLQMPHRQTVQVMRTRCRQC